MGIQQIPLASSGLTQSQLLTEPTWTLLNTTSANNVNVVNITGLSGYNRYKVFVSNLLVTTNGDKPAWWFNNDTNNVFYQNYFQKSVAPTIGIQSSNGPTGYYYMTNLGWRNDGYNPLGYIEISNANSTGHKHIKHECSLVDSNAHQCAIFGFGLYTGTSAISQISVGMQFGGNFYMNQIYTYGAN